MALGDLMASRFSQSSATFVSSHLEDYDNHEDGETESSNPHRIRDSLETAHNSYAGSGSGSASGDNATISMRCVRPGFLPRLRLPLLLIPINRRLHVVPLSSNSLLINNFTSETAHKHRYILNSTAQSNSPIFTWLGAESPIDYDPLDIGFLTDNAPRFKPLLVYIEHKDYGLHVVYLKEGCGVIPVCPVCQEREETIFHALVAYDKGVFVSLN
nr:lysosomal Pro-X carboxypeptidase-like [Ipomoea trifida]